jgi:hypothetical protein
MNTIWKRVGGIVVIVISVIVLLTSVGGIVGLWIVNGAAHDLTSAVFSPIQSGLNTANTTLNNVNTHVDNARSRISNAQQSLGQLGQNSPGNGPVLGAISDTVAARLGPQIEQAQESISNTLQFITGVNQSIVAVNKLPGVDLPTLSDASDALQPRVTALSDKLQGLRTNLQSMVQGRLQVTSDRINSLLTDLDSALQGVQSTVNTNIGRVQQAQTRATGAQDNLNSWITIGWIVATIFWLWVAISQVVMIMYGWSLFRSKSTDLAVPAAPASGGDVTSTATNPESGG